MIDSILIVIVLATVGDHQEPRSAFKRGFNETECVAAASVFKPGTLTPAGDLIIITACAKAAAPDAPKEEAHPDPRNKGAI